MKDTVVRLEGEELRRVRLMETQIMALQSGSCDLSIEDATNLMWKHDDMWAGLRERHELEETEDYALDRQTGYIFVLPSE